MDDEDVDQRDEAIPFQDNVADKQERKIGVQHRKETSDMSVEFTSETKHIVI